MKRKSITYVNKEELDRLREKHPKAQYFESKKYLKLRLSPREEIRCYK